MLRTAAAMTPRIPLKILLIIAALASFVGLTAAARTWRATARADTLAAASVPVPQPTTAQGVSGSLPVVRVTIRPTGFDPSELTLPQGRFILVVDNRTGLRELTFRLDREGAGRLREVRMPRERLSYREVFDPPPGVYVLTEAEHPTWVCRVRVGD